MTRSSLSRKVGHSIFRQRCLKKSLIIGQLPRASTPGPGFAQTMITDNDLLQAQRHSSIPISYVIWFTVLVILPALPPHPPELPPLCPKTSWDEASEQGRTITFLCLELVRLSRAQVGTWGYVLVTYLSFNPSKHVTMGGKAGKEQNSSSILFLCFKKSVFFKKT